MCRAIELRPFSISFTGRCTSKPPIESLNTTQNASQFGMVLSFQIVLLT